MPVKDAVTAAYWEGCARGELLLQRCAACGGYQFYPRALCTRCQSAELEWVRSSGRGEVYTYTVVRQNSLPGFRDEVPYVLAQVQLAEGVRLMTNIVACAPEDVRIGLPVEVVFERVTDAIALPKFRPAGPNPRPLP